MEFQIEMDERNEIILDSKSLETKLQREVQQTESINEKYEK